MTYPAQRSCANCIWEEKCRALDVLDDCNANDCDYYEFIDFTGVDVENYLRDLAERHAEYTKHVAEMNG